MGKISTPNGGISGTLAVDLEGHWSFDSGSLLDESGNGRDLILTNTLVSALDKDGNVNQAVDVYNNSYYKTNDAINPLAGLTTWSISLWVNIKAYVSNEGYITFANNNSYYIYRDSALAFSFRLVGFTTTNGWQNWIITYDNGFNTLYINGTLKASFNLILTDLSNTLTFGKRLDIPERFPNADMDEIRIYSRSLELTEISELFEMGVNYTLQQAETPTATPPSGEYTETQYIELTSGTTGASIYYTTDGTDPDDNDTLYTGSIEISENTILKAIAYAEGFLPSNILTEIYNIEGGNLQMNESQSAGLLALFWTPTGSTVETVLGETPLDGAEVLSMQEVISFFNTKYAGNHPTEARVMAGASTFTVDLIESPTLRALLSNTTVVEGTKKVIGMNTGKRAITGKLRLHPMYNGSDLTEDIILLKVAPQMTDERTFATENGKKLIKVVFTVMGVKTNLATPAVTDFVTPTTGSVSYKMLNANDLGTSAASATETGAATGDMTFTPGTGTNRVIFYKSTDAFATYAATSYYEVSAAEYAAGSIATGTVAWVALTSAAQLAAIPSVATGYYYKAIEIGV